MTFVRAAVVVCMALAAAGAAGRATGRPHPPASGDRAAIVEAAPVAPVARWTWPPPRLARPMVLTPAAHHVFVGEVRPIRAAATRIAPVVSASAVRAAQPAAETHAELEIGVLANLTASAPVRWMLALHLDAAYPIGPATLHLTLDPGVWFDGRAHWVPGLTEAYLARRAGPLDLHAGIERLPLEVARLTLPFSIEPVDALGTRRGLAGARLLWYPDSATRLRVGLLWDQGKAIPVVSVRREFGAFELEAHALRYAGQRVLGLGGSGLVGDLVVYGEVWALRPRWRYAAGVSGTIREGLWTLEAGYASEVPGALPRAQVAGQIATRVRADLSVTITARAFRDPDAYRGQVVLQLVRAAGNTDLTAALAAYVGPEPLQVIAGFAWRLSF